MFKAIFGRAVSKTAVKNITPAQVQEKLDNNQPILMLDVRQPREYAQNGHIEGSRLMPLNSLIDRLNELPSDTLIICVCRSGARSRTACELLSRQGFSDVANMGGGMISWKRAGLPLK
ncbi:MAG: rhodanese-like domain-containing protein [Chloroflexi bacterium]|nr:rhodanese-like domain-containing protein [Chloroflexota bacterium]